MSIYIFQDYKKLKFYVLIVNNRENKMISNKTSFQINFILAEKSLGSRIVTILTIYLINNSF